MIQLQLPSSVLERLHSALQHAGSKEIGGVLVGEHVAENVFRLVDLSLQVTPGNRVCFVRLPAEHAAFVEEFHKSTGYDYKRFNYLGEWHSHPSFPVTPSAQDCFTMQAIVDDEEEPAQFAVLLIARTLSHRLNLQAAFFSAGQQPVPVALEIEGSAPAVTND